MIEISVDPILHIGNLGIRWLGVGAVAFFILAIIIFITEARRRKRRIRRSTVGLSLSLILGYAIGGRLFYVLDNFSYFANHPEGIIDYPIVMYGVVVGMVVALFIYSRVVRCPQWSNGDIFAPGIMLGFALYRSGCIINGCCYGLPATVPWAVVYTHPDSLAPTGIALHPTQVYHLILGLIAFTVLWTLRKKLPREGTLFLLWLVLFAASDLPVRFLRVANSFLFGWQLAQLVDVALLAFAVPLFIVRIRHSSSVLSSPSSPPSP